MLDSFFSKFEFRPLKFGFNSNFVYTFVEKFKQFTFDVCTMGRNEGHSTHATCREAVYQQCNQPGRQAMSHSIAVHRCLLCVWATLIACMGCNARWRVIECCGGMQEGEGKRGVSKHAAGVAWIEGQQRTKKSSHRWSNVK